MRHPVAGRRGPHARPRHPLQRAVLGRGAHADAGDRARDRRSRRALHRRAAARAAAVINEARRRARVTGTDLLGRFASAGPLDLFGIDADRVDSGVHPSPTCPRPSCTPSSRGGASTSIRSAGRRSASRCSRRCTSGCRSSPSARPRSTRPCPRRPACVSTRVDVLADAMRRLIDDPDEARERGAAARAAALERYGLERFLADWDDLLAEVARMRIAMVSEHASPLAVLGGVDAGGQNVHVAALATRARRGAATRSSSTPAATTRRCRRSVQLAPRRRRRPRRRRAGARACPRTSCCRTCRRSRSACATQWRAGPPGRRARALLDVRARRARGGRAAGHPGRAHLPRARHRQAAPPGRRRHQPAATARRRAR